MGDRASDVELLLASVRQEIDALAGDPRLKEPADGNRGRALYWHVRDLIAAAEHQLGKKPADGAPENVEESFDRLLRALLNTLRQAHAAIPWLLATRSPQINLGTLYLAEECAEILVGSDVDLVVVPDPEYMYSAQGWPFGRVVEWVKGYTPTARNHPVILRYPLSDDNRLLLHSIFSHELGHPAAQTHGLVDTALSELEGDREYEVGLEETVAKAFPAAPRGTAAGTVRAWLRDWLEETICDHLAVELDGPAYLWAFAGFVMPLSYDSPSPTHPPNTVRVKLMLEHLSALGWRNYLQERTPVLLRWLDSVGGHTEGGLVPPFDFLRDQLAENGDLLRRVVDPISAKRRLDPDDAVPDSDTAQSLLENLILPVGDGRGLPPRAILLGGWQRALDVYGDNPTGLVSSLSDRSLQDLVGKAIELSVVAHSWRGEG